MSEPQHTESREDPATAAEGILRSLREYGIEYVFGNFGTDHAPLLEAAAKVRETDPESIPEFVICPHESAALSAAHGRAYATGEAQAVVVHVDVGTQNLGAMVHNAHRGNAPVFIMAGLAPVSHAGSPGSRNSGVHFLQDIYDQAGIVRQFCRWTGEYRSSADPDELVARGLELATTPRRGPTYLTATREALEADVDATPGRHRANGVAPAPADTETVEELAAAVAEADAPLVITSKLGTFDPDESVNALVEFAEAAGAGVLESRPSALCFPRSHEQHAGFSPATAFEETDLILLADTDVPWLPGSDAVPPEDVPIVQVDVDPNKPDYPQWNFSVDRAVRADPAATLAAVADRLDGNPAGRETWRAVSTARKEERAETLETHREGDAVTAALLSDAIDRLMDDSTVVVNETTTNGFTVMNHLDIDEPGGYLSSHGSGLGWAPGAAVGASIANPDSTVLSLVGDGSYVFGQPTATAWMADTYDAPTLTVIYNNGGWNAVRSSTLSSHPEGSAATVDVPESKFSPRFDLSHAANVVDAHTDVVESSDRLDEALEAGFAAVADGRPAVLDVRLEPI